MSELTLPSRTSKPRKSGLTAITDLGVPIKALREMLEDYHPFLDVAKFGVGSAYVTPRLEEKLDIYRQFNVIPYFGGTLFEKFYQQGGIAKYVEYLKKYKLDWIEISNGTIDLSLDERVRLVRELSGTFKVFAEVGCKDANKVMAPSEWIHELQALLEAGASYVITEGRDSGTAGIYRASGEIREGLLSDILKSVDPTRIICEAPTPKSQMDFINLVGPNVNLGNVASKDVLLVETQRVGLRYETFFAQSA